MKFGDYPKVGSLDGVAGFRAHLASLGLDMPCDEIVASGAASPLAAPIEIAGLTHRQPLRHPADGGLGRRARRHAERQHACGAGSTSAQSGAKLIWGGEAVAVRPDGRANPNQLLHRRTQPQAAIADLRESSSPPTAQAIGDDEGLVVGLQLTHSGRFCKPNDNDRFEPQIAYRHPDPRPEVRLSGRSSAHERRRDHAG